ncbi:potassium transporter TrkG [Mycoplasmoides genitalium]|uniref:TrkH family potassium uptake protein n=1 Tax=Mycoplasmoides genitalium M6320 TaxID=662945 RepID=A0ABC7ZJ13_MYCGT|nr:potassium transporter TrkG [Mycoplasmoides genitalium]AFQ04149.1 TrkH family potassium uptake protein [Mycoplasmoides genitalium M6320]AFQ04652.1 TrkH family potassium uptake protein [Mycoplasmoides genitalium M2288]
MKRRQNQMAKLTTWLKKIGWGETITQRIFCFYIYCILFGSLLLFLPIALQDNYQKVVSYGIDWQGKRFEQKTDYNFLDALFLSTSAFSDTGLSTVVVSKTYSIFGQIVLAVLLQLGGIGFVVIAFLTWRLFNFHKKEQYSFYEKLMLQSERGGSKLGNTSEMILVSIIFLFIVELIYGFLYGILFYFIPGFEPANLFADHAKVSTQLKALVVDSNQTIAAFNDINKAFQAGFFHSLSAVNNAGIDLIGGSSFVPYRNGLGIIIQWLTISQIIFGGIGYPCLFDGFEAIKKKIKYGRHTKHQFSLFTKLTVITNIVVILLFFTLLLMVEFIASDSLTNTIVNFSDEKKSLINTQLQSQSNQAIHASVFGNNPNASRVMQLFFMVISSRSAGFSVFPVASEIQTTKIIIALAMFIGASPSSTAGGIRTTTLAVIFLALVAKFKGQKEVKAFKRSIDQTTVIDAFLVLILSLIAVLLTAVLLPLSMEQPVSFIDALFETTSAFGTVGLSSGATVNIALDPNRNTFNFLALCLLMVMGQVGVSSSVLTFVRKHPKANSYSYPKEAVKIG